MTDRIRRLSEVEVNATANGESGSSSPHKKAKTADANSDVVAAKKMYMYTFSLKGVPNHCQGLSSTMFSELVEFFLALKAKNDHCFDDCLPWNIQMPNGVVFYSPSTTKHQQAWKPIAGVTISDIAPHLHENDVLSMGYNYRADMQLVFRIQKIDLMKTNAGEGFQESQFPRVKPPSPCPPITYQTDKIKLDCHFPFLCEWLKKKADIHFFRPGQKQAFGFMDYRRHMVLVPDKPKTLYHSINCLNKGATVALDRSSDWQSTIVLPSQNKVEKYSEGLGSCDSVLLCRHWDEGATLHDILPKTAALAGYLQDRRVPKGWVSYTHSDSSGSFGVLRIVTGKGSPKEVPQAPKKTAYDGLGVHKPSSNDTVLFRVEKTFTSVHELFCMVETLLQKL